MNKMTRKEMNQVITKIKMESKKMGKNKTMEKSINWMR